MQGNGETSHILPFLKLGHSQIKFPDTKAIRSTRISRATGNLHFFQFLFVVKYHIFLLKGTPQLSYPSLAMDAHRCPGLVGHSAGPAAVLCFWRRKTWGCSPALRNAEEPRCAAQRQTTPASFREHAAVIKQHLQRCLMKCFLPIQELLLWPG